MHSVVEHVAVCFEKPRVCVFDVLLNVLKKVRVRAACGRVLESDFNAFSEEFQWHDIVAYNGVLKPLRLPDVLVYLLIGVIPGAEGSACCGIGGGLGGMFIPSPGFPGAAHTAHIK